MNTVRCGSFTMARRYAARLPGWATISLTIMLSMLVRAESVSYTFTKLATLGDPVPGGKLINDFEPGALNNSGDVIFGADLGTSTDPASFFGEGVFLLNARQSIPLELARGTGDAPGGGVFDFLLIGQTPSMPKGMAHLPLRSARLIRPLFPLGCTGASIAILTIPAQ